MLRELTLPELEVVSGGTDQSTVGTTGTRGSGDGWRSISAEEAKRLLSSDPLAGGIYDNGLYYGGDGGGDGTPADDTDRSLPDCDALIASTSNTLNNTASVMGAAAALIGIISTRMTGGLAQGVARGSAGGLGAGAATIVVGSAGGASVAGQACTPTA